MESFKVELEIPKVVAFVRAGTEMVFNIEDMPRDMLAALVEHGLTQKVGDSAAGKEGDEARDAMRKTFENLMVGEWGAKRGPKPSGDGITRDSFFWRAVEGVAAMPKKKGEKADAHKERLEAWFGESTTSRREKVVALAAKWREAAEAAEAAKRAEAAEIAALLAESTGE